MSIVFEPDVWRGVSSKVGLVADGVDGARCAGGAALSGNAFGLMCSPLLLPPYLVVAGIADQVMASVAGGLRRTAGNLADAAGGFEEADSRAEEAVDSLFGLLGGVW